MSAAYKDYGYQSAGLGWAHAYLLSHLRSMLGKAGGEFIVSTPYHGYLKNLALAATGKLDAHFTVLWDGGHIKFFSRRTLEQMLREQGFESPDLQERVACPGCGRACC